MKTINLKTANNVKLYMDESVKPLVLILPGGGYGYASEREGAPIAKFFNDAGYHAAVYYYRNTLIKHPDVILEAIEVVEILKKLKNVSSLLVIGFSAGGHLAAHLLTSVPKAFSAGILCYPVITSNPKYTHRGSFEMLTNNLDEKELETLSLENNVTSNMPPIFLWHTVDDNCVPVENSLLFFESLRKHQVPVEAHFFSSGIHGLSLANELTPPGHENEDVEEFKKENEAVALWPVLMLNWLKKLGIKN